MTCDQFHTIAPRAFYLSNTELHAVLNHMDECKACRDLCAQADEEMTPELPPEINMALNDIGSHMADRVLKQEEIDPELR